MIDLVGFITRIQDETETAGTGAIAANHRNRFKKEWRDARRLDLIRTWRDNQGVELVQIGPQEPPQRRKEITRWRQPRSR